ncbi:MAG: hypothetical protein QW057_07160 [Candidatus Bathyarchaeia archaeon]
MRPTVLVTAAISEEDIAEALALLRQKAEVRISRLCRALAEQELLQEPKGVDTIFAGGDP